MPELAEVETLRRGVHQLFVGRRIESVRLGSPRTTRRHVDPGEIAAVLPGRTVTGTGRRGKYLVIDLDGSEAIVAHMGMSGQLLSAPPAEPSAPHTHFALSFDAGPDLRYVDPRTFGQIWLAARTGPEPSDVEGLEHLGPDAIGPELGPAELRRMLAKRRTKLKPLLMDQRFIAGIGNMYADEILHAARLHPDRSAATLTAAEVGRLHTAVRSVLIGAIEHRGSSLADEQYRDVHGMLGSYQYFHAAYGREGLPCGRCATPIVRVRFAGRSSFYCPRCQRDGRRMPQAASRGH